MSGHGRRVYFETEVRSARRGQSSRRGRSADRIHSILDDYTIAADMPGRERATGRDDYERLARENHYLRIEIRELQNAQERVARLEAENAELQRENRELRRSVDYNSDNDARKLGRLRKKYAKLEAELTDWKTKANDWHQLFEDVNRSYLEVKRRADAFLGSVRTLEASKLRLEQENADLRRDLELERRLRRRPYP